MAREVAVVGLGLVGGSLARALTAAGYRVLGVDRESVRRQARAAGAVAATVGTVERAARADLVVLAAPPAANRSAPAAPGPRGSPRPGHHRRGERQGPHRRRRGRAGAGLVRRGPRHGRHRGRGFSASSSGLFRGAPWWIVPAPDPRATRAVRSLVRAVGARPRTIDRRRPRPGGGLPQPRSPGHVLGPPGGGPRRPGGPSSPVGRGPGLSGHDPSRPQSPGPLARDPPGERAGGRPRPRGPRPASRRGPDAPVGSRHEAARSWNRRCGPRRPRRGRGVQPGPGRGGAGGGGADARAARRRPSPRGRLAAFERALAEARAALAEGRYTDSLRITQDLPSRIHAAIARGGGPCRARRGDARTRARPVAHPAARPADPDSRPSRRHEDVASPASGS